MVGIQNKEFFVGFEALLKQNLLNLVDPVEDGVITNWSLVEQLWHHVFVNELHVDPENFCVLPGEKPLLPPDGRERLVQIFFGHTRSAVFQLPAVGLGTFQLRANNGDRP
jgi:actin-related protein